MFQLWRRYFRVEGFVRFVADPDPKSIDRQAKGVLASDAKRQLNTSDIQFTVIFGWKTIHDSQTHVTLTDSLIPPIQYNKFTNTKITIETIGRSGCEKTGAITQEGSSLAQRGQPQAATEARRCAPELLLKEDRLNLAEGGIGSGFPYAYQLGSDIETNELLAMKLSGPEFGNVHHDTAEEFDDTTNSVSMSPTIPRIALDRELAGPSEIRKLDRFDRKRCRDLWYLCFSAVDFGYSATISRTSDSCHLLQCPGQLRIVDIRNPCSSFSVPSEFKYLIPERRERSGGRTSCDHETRVNRTGSKPRLTRIPSGAWRQEKHPSSALQEEDLPPPGWTRRPANARGTAAIIT
ncbi:unnamed protein product [Nesidiocoris tenuis]|uniref:Uncharacterized protein n=1 Tax=Nesidiocoris tenuis TaxID=355587 RepID=A0A6H5H0L6_9HEMI|nr:unnamed protein product [Nesidiocoris tenuis]